MAVSRLRMPSPGTTTSLLIFTSPYEKDYIQHVHVDKYEVALTDQRRQSRVAFPLGEWDAFESYLLRFLLYHGMYLVETAASVACGTLSHAPPAFTVDDVNAHHPLTSTVMVTMVPHGQRGHKALDVRVYGGGLGGYRFPSTTGVRLPVMSAASLYSKAKEVRAAILRRGDTVLLAAMLPQLHMNIVNATVEWLESKHRGSVRDRCDGCVQGLENQQGHECVMGWTPEKLGETFDLYYEDRSEEAIAELYTRDTGLPFPVTYATQRDTMSLMDELTRRLLCIDSRHEVAAALAARTAGKALAANVTSRRKRKEEEGEEVVPRKLAVVKEERMFV